MKFWIIHLFLLFFFVQSSSATLLNCSFTGTGEVLNNTLGQHGIFDGDTVSYGGNYFIDTDLIAIDHMDYYGDWVANIYTSGDFVISGAITVNDIILPVMPESNASLHWKLIAEPPIYETYFHFDVLSPFPGEVYSQVFTMGFPTTTATANFNTENYFDQDDPFLQPLLSESSYGIPTLGGLVGSTGSQVSIVLIGDVNDNGQVDLADAILCLKVVSGFVPSNIHPGADVDGDGKVGLGEAIYAIQKVAGY